MVSVVVPVAGFVLVVSVVVVLVCANARGAISAQAKLTIIRFICFPPSLGYRFFDIDQPRNIRGDCKHARLVDAETDYKKSPPVLGRPVTLIRKSVLLNCLILSSCVAPRLFSPAGLHAG